VRVYLQQGRYRSREEGVRIVTLRAIFGHLALPGPALGRFLDQL